MEVNFLTEKRNPDLFYFRYYANNYRWHQNLNSIYTSKLTSKLFLFNKKLYLENVVFQNRNLIWFYTPDLPLQYENNIFSSRSGIGTNLTYEHIYFHAQFNYQYTTNSEIFAIPEFQIQSQLFYQRQSHNKEMQFQAGFQLNYFSSFQSNAYNPGTNMFYVTGRDKCGNYPFIDFFFNAEIQPVKFFILIDHLNQGFSGSNYFLTPGLPMADRSIKFGFTWLFWD